MKSTGRRDNPRKPAEQAENLPRIAISMGDPGGIGPEVALKALCDPAVWEVCQPVLVGDVRFLRNLAQMRRLWTEVKCLPARPYREIGLAVRRTGRGKVVSFRELKMLKQSIWVHDGARVSRSAPLGRPSRAGGRAAGKAIEEAVRLAMEGQVDGIVTAPVSKESLAFAGYGMVGHTEIIARLTKTKRYAMMMVSEDLRVVFATTHVPLRRVARGITVKGLLEKFMLTQEFLRLYMGIDDAIIGVCCLNPHGGEGGLLSKEELTIIEPAVALARGRGISVHGPYPADSIFWSALATGLDAIVAMYHDQGMIPIKRGDPHACVNITLGIPFVRTSPGHGTAFDLTGQGRASERGMVNAILECARIAGRVSLRKS